MSSIEFTMDQQEHLLDKLQTLLDAQESMIKKSDLRSVEMLCEQADPILAALAKIPSPRPSQWKNRCRRR